MLAVEVGVMRGRCEYLSIEVLVIEKQGWFFDGERRLLLDESIAAEVRSNRFRLLLFVYHNALVVDWPIE